MVMRAFILAVAIISLLATVGYGQQNEKGEMQKSMMSGESGGITKAVCVLMPAENGKVHGVVTFEKVKDGMKVTADVTGLTPGEHGFHIHQYGDCSSPDYKSAGSHLMAPGDMHAGPNDPKRHIGDMGNLVADKDGNAHLTLVDSKLSFTGPNSIIGRGIIVHAGQDDLTTQPTGNAGGRVACGTIGIAK
jgi:Cu-Zn family superoxide dismutase